MFSSAPNTRFGTCKNIQQIMTTVTKHRATRKGTGHVPVSKATQLQFVKFVSRMRYIVSNKQSPNNMDNCEDCETTEIVETSRSELYCWHALFNNHHLNSAFEPDGFVTSAIDVLDRDVTLVTNAGVTGTGYQVDSKCSDHKYHPTHHYLFCTLK